MGSWVLDYHRIPRDIWFSQYGNLPWIDSSWLFDALTSAAVRVFGLRGLLFLGLAFASATAVAVSVLARCPRGGFWSGAVLTALGAYLLAGLPLRSSLASVVLFTVPLALIAMPDRLPVAVASIFCRHSFCFGLTSTSNSCMA